MHARQQKEEYVCVYSFEILDLDQRARRMIVVDNLNLMKRFEESRS